MGRRGVRDLKTRMGRECSISRRGPDCIVKIYMSEESEEGITVLRVGTRQGGSSKGESCQEF